MTERLKHPLFEKAYIYKQKGSNNWFLDYINAYGKRERKSAKTAIEKEAMTKLSKVVSISEAIRTGEVEVYRTNDKKISEAIQYTIEAYLNENNTALQTRKRYISKLKDAQKFFESKKIVYLKDIKSEHLREFLNHNYSSTVLQCNKTALKRVFDFAIENSWIDRHIIIPKVEKKKTQPRKALSKEQVINLKGFVIDRLSDFEARDWKGFVINHRARRRAKEEEFLNTFLLLKFIIFMEQTGFRNGEIENLKYSDIEEVIDDKVIINIRVSKTEPRKAIITFNLLQNILEIKDKIKPKSEDDYIFFNPILNKVPKFSEVLNSIRAHNEERFKEAGIFDIVLYQLRHTFITERIYAGADITALSQHCGTSITMIHKHYLSEINTRDKSKVYIKVEDKTEVEMREEHARLLEIQKAIKEDFV